MQNGEDLKAKAKKALNKKGQYGKDFELERYEAAPYDLGEMEDLDDIPDDVQKSMINVGILPSGEGRSGSMLFMDNSVVHRSTQNVDGLEMLSTRQALAKYNGLKEYSWRLVSPEKDKYTARSFLEDADGYFIRARAGAKVEMPVQTCMLIGSDKKAQEVHNIIIVEEGASLDILTGCSTGKHANESLHLGMSEIYVKDGGKLTFSMIHSWGEKTGVRPRTVVQMGSNAQFVNNYVLLRPVESLQSYPVAYVNGENSSVKFNSICISHPGSEVDVGSMAVLNAPGAGAEIVSRSITMGGMMTARGRLVGNAPRVKAHLECRSLIMKEGGMTLAIPELEASVPDVEMTHEAAMGKIAREQVEYLMARGLSEDDAVGMIVRGFLEGGIKGLPDALRQEIDEAMSSTNLGS
ncbi:MAG: SufD family Fe-S cluster assembly protein [Candidatus Methanomethylophilaceae archaeon]|jgi:Fe-S cluster assembly scaffold protein SufB